jgi:hypothetical protein
MKTTLDISDPLLDEVRKIAARENTTLRALVEQKTAAQEIQAPQSRLQRRGTGSGAEGYVVAKNIGPIL